MNSNNREMQVWLAWGCWGWEEGVEVRALDGRINSSPGQNRNFGLFSEPEEKAWKVFEQRNDLI